MYALHRGQVKRSGQPGCIAVRMPGGFVHGLAVPFGAVRSLGRRSRAAGLPPEGWRTAGIAQLVEHHLAKVGVAGSSPVSRSDTPVGSPWMRSARSPGGFFHGRPGGDGRCRAPPSCRRRSQVVRQRSAKPPFGGSNPPGASSPQGGRLTTGSTASAAAAAGTPLHTCWSRPPCRSRRRGMPSRHPRTPVDRPRRAWCRTSRFPRGIRDR